MATMLFHTLEEFKSRKGITVISIVLNPNTNKLFASTTAGNFKVQGSIDVAKPIRFMYESDALYDEGCITNVAESNNVKFTL